MNSDSADSRLIITRWLIREISGVIILAVLLFFSAGSVKWWNGWVLVIITLLWVVANAVILIPRNPGLLGERLGPKKGTKSWDTIILMIIGLMTTARCVIAGLDYRFGWSSDISPTLEIIMVAVVLSGHVMLVWATASNAFFAQSVRIQEERGHTVASGGPYRFVRHPGYLGTLFSEIAVPVMLGSLWALVPGLILSILVVIRTTLEDRTLHNELEGYKEYSMRVKYRLLPLVW